MKARIFCVLFAALAACRAHAGLPVISEDGIMGSSDRKAVGSALGGALRGEKFAQYGNWYGPGWWGGNNAPDKPGTRAPVDSLDAVAMRHDFGYQIAEKQGAIYGAKEEQRLKALADYIAVQDTLKLDPDPAKWEKPPKDMEKANRYRDKITTGFSYLSPGRDASSYAVTAADWATSPLENWETDTSNKYDGKQLAKAVGILQNNWNQNHPDATDSDATAEQDERDRPKAAAYVPTQADIDAARREGGEDKEVQLSSGRDMIDVSNLPHAGPEDAQETPADASIPVIPVDCTISMTFWGRQSPEHKITEEYKVLDGNVTGSWYKDYGNGVKYSGHFTGTIKDNVITGRDVYKMEPFRSSSENFESITYTSGTSDTTTTLNLDGSVTVRGTSNWNWRIEVIRGSLSEGAPRQRSDSSSIDPAEVAGRWHIVGRNK